MRTIKCEICNTEIGYVNYSRHIKNCKGIPPKKRQIKIQKNWLLPNGKYKCPYCDREYLKDGIGIHIWKNHTEEGKNFDAFKDVRAWSKGLTKENDERINKRAQKLSVALKGKPGHKHTEETKDLLSRKRIEYLENNDQYTSWFKISNGNKIINVQGTWEKRFAEYLNQNNIKWDRFSIKYDNHRRYTPDFYLPEFNIYIEVKGWMKDRDIEKMKKFLYDNSDCDIRLLDNHKLFSQLENNEISVLDLIKFNNKY